MSDRCDTLFSFKKSMKMEIPIHAPCAGVVSRLLLSAGNRVNAGQALIIIEESVLEEQV